MQHLPISLLFAFAAIAVVLAGYFENNPDSASGVGMSSEDGSCELAAYAASRQFPGNVQGRDDLHTAAIVNRGGGIIRLYNFDSVPLRNVDVWVNQSFVLHVGAVPANGSVEVRFGDLYNAVGRDLASENEPIRQVQLATDENVYNAWGPASE